jgi:pyruvate kinase
VHQLAALIEAGVDVFRINTAHGDREQHERTLANIRSAAARCRFHVGVLLDLAGPKIRLGEIPGGSLHCEEGMPVCFVRGDHSTAAQELTSSYPRLIDELDPGDRVLLADGTVAFVVEEVSADRAHCRVTAGGTISSRQGINLPGVKLSVPAMLPRDVDNAVWAAKNGIDFVSLSFVRSENDVRALKDLLAEHDCDALVVAKIEKPEALQRLGAIVEATDAVMVARGDLGVEIDVAETPIAQKRIIRVCKAKMKPVIVATQMLESMHHHSRPTRAEASDVANAILDGTDACMLSGETAVGEHPVKTVQVMNRIMKVTEREMLRDSASLHHANTRVHPITSAVTEAGTQIAESIRAKLIVIATKSGNTAWVKSNSRSLIPTLGASDGEESLRRMNLMWGIKPIQVSQMENTQAFVDEVCRWGREHAGLQTGDQTVFVVGNGVIPKTKNQVSVYTVE